MPNGVSQKEFNLVAAKHSTRSERYVKLARKENIVDAFVRMEIRVQNCWARAKYLLSVLFDLFSFDSSCAVRAPGVWHGCIWSIGAPVSAS
jgi:hypothetical protein